MTDVVTVTPIIEADGYHRGRFETWCTCGDQREHVTRIAADEFKKKHEGWHQRLSV